MAIFKITPAGSVLTMTTDFGVSAFASDTAGADTLIVDPSAFLIATGAGAADGAFLANTGAWTVTVNGLIVSQHDNGITLSSFDTAVSTIKIGLDGEVSGLLAAFPSTVPRTSTMPGWSTAPMVMVL